MTQIDGLQFTQLTNLNVEGELYEHGSPFGGVTAPLVLSTMNNASERPLKLRGGASEAGENYDSINSALIFTDADDNELWRVWATNSIAAEPNGGNLYVGWEAGNDQPTQSENASAGHHNTGVGYATLASITTGNDNTAVGINALAGNLTGSSNTAFGSHALLVSIGAGNNTGVGFNALTSNVSGVRSVAVGSGALEDATGNDNTAVGHIAGRNITTGIQNVVVGEGAAQAALDMSNNTVVGQRALEDATAGGQNTVMGRIAMSNLTSGSNNIGIGHQIATSLTSGSGNTFIGHEVDSSAASVTDELNLCNVITCADVTDAFGLVVIKMKSTDPVVAGVLWNDSGTVKVSTGA